MKTELLAVLLAFTPPSTEEPEVLVTVQETSGFERIHSVVSVGIPFARGALPVTSLGAPVAIQIDEHPTQSRVLALWPDGSPRWAIARFLADLPARTTSTFRLLPTAPSEQRPLATPVAQAEHPTLQIDTGSLQTTLSTHGPLFGPVTVAGQPILADTDQSGIVLIHHDRTRYQGRVESLEIIENGPVLAMVELRGHFFDDRDSTLLPRATDDPDHAIEFRVWLTFAHQQSTIDWSFLLHNPGGNDLQAFEGPVKVDGTRYEGKDHLKQWLYFQELRIDVPFAAAQPFAVASGPHRGVVGPDESARVLQVYDPRGRGSVNQRFRANLQIGSEEWQSSQHPGWLQALSSTHSVLAGFQDFWQNWPKGLSLTNAGVGFEIFPRLPTGTASTISYAGAKSIFDVQSWTDGSKANEPEDFKFPRHFHCFQGGRMKAHRALLSFTDADHPNDARVHRQFEQPLLARVDGHYMLSTRALLDYYPDAVSPPDTSTLLHSAITGRKRWRQSLLHPEAKNADTLESVRMSTTQGGWANLFGYANFGDLAWGGSQGHYCNLHYDWAYGLLTDYLRYGDPKALIIGDQMARYRREWGQYHHVGGMVWADGLSWYEASDHGFEPERPRRTHNWNGGLLLHYLLTGDPLSREAAIENAEGCYASFFWQYRLGAKLDKTKIFPSTREQGWAILSMVHGYELTLDTKYLEQSKRVLRQITIPTVAKAGGMRKFVRDQGSLMFGYASLGFIKLYYALPEADPARKEILRLLVDVVDGVETKAVKTPAQYHNGLFTPPNTRTRGANRRQLTVSYTQTSSPSFGARPPNMTVFEPDF